jgi:hypothetical protein
MEPRELIKLDRDVRRLRDALAEGIGPPPKDDK